MILGRSVFSHRSRQQQVATRSRSWTTQNMWPCWMRPGLNKCLRRGRCPQLKRQELPPFDATVPCSGERFSEYYGTASPVAAGWPSAEAGPEETGRILALEKTSTREDDYGATSSHIHNNLQTIKMFPPRASGKVPPQEVARIYKDSKANQLIGSWGLRGASWEPLGASWEI